MRTALPLTLEIHERERNGKNYRFIKFIDQETGVPLVKCYLDRKFVGEYLYADTVPDDISIDHSVSTIFAQLAIAEAQGSFKSSQEAMKKHAD